MRLLTPCVIFLLAGCSAGGKAPTLLPGDTVRPQIAFAPDAPWKAGDTVALGILVEIRRPGRDAVAFLADADPLTADAEMAARVEFLSGDALVGEALDVPIHRDC